MLIDANFDVWPCRFLAGKDFRSLGNIHNEAAAAVWNGPRSREYRSEFTSAILNRPVKGLYLCDRCTSCNLRETLADDRFFRESEAWFERQRAGMSAPIFQSASSREGFSHPALRGLRERFPLSQFQPGSLEIVERIHAEAEIAREESLELCVRAAKLDARSTRPPRDVFAVGEAEQARIESANLKKIARELDAHSQWLFEEAHFVGGSELVAAAPSPFESMHEWLRRLHEFDPSVETKVDHGYIIWASHFKTLTEHADMSKIEHVLGVGVGFDGPEINYNDHFPEHYCLDLVDYSDRNPKLKFITANIEEKVPFPDSSFDLIYSHSMFEHLKNVRNAMSEINRLLRLGRYVYITVSPLYYSPAGSHVNVPQTLENWEHLYPDNEHYLLDSPHPTLIDQGVFLNKMTVADFLLEVGRVGWEILHFELRIVHPRDVPEDLKARYPLVDLVAREYRFIGRKVIP
jgi:SAM-dependent methyltransferase